MTRLVLFIALLTPSTGFTADTVKAILFHSPHCKYCLNVRHSFLPAVKTKYAGKVEWEELSTEEPQNLARLTALAEARKREPLIPAVLVGDTYLVGRSEIVGGLEKALDSALLRGTATADTGSKDLFAIFRDMSVMAVVAAGLIDGINPCAFAVIVFFVSFLAVYGYSRREILIIGGAYCAAVFAAYLLIGLGVFRLLYSLSAFYMLMKVFYYLIAAMCFVFFGLSLYDYFVYRTTGESEGLLLQLPKPLKLAVNRIIGGQLRPEENRSTFLKLTLASLVVGFAVSIIEAVCTGQVYVPTIVFILKNTAMRAQALSYLVLYNIMFIVPLLAVFALFLMGFQSERFNRLLKEHLGLAKILLALVFLGLAALLLISA